MEWLTDLLKEYPALEVARERIVAAETQIAAMESENFRLRGENARLKERLSALARSIPRDFVEARGVLFKRTDGGFEPDAYCPDCIRALSLDEARSRWVCSKCGFIAPFALSDLTRLVASLRR
jgi:hypothetical protein